jgi:hypothetical protein
VDATYHVTQSNHTHRIGETELTIKKGVETGTREIYRYWCIAVSCLDAIMAMMPLIYKVKI